MIKIPSIINISRVPAVNWIITKSIETQRWVTVSIMTTRPIRVIATINNPSLFFKINGDREVT